MAQQLPFYMDVNGLKRVAVNQRNPNRTAASPMELIPKEENSWTFTLLASAVNIGLQILESPAGKAALETLGVLVVKEWHADRRHQFGGNIEKMAAYVDHFLTALREDFPNIVVDDLGGPDVLAFTKRLQENLWDGNLLNYRPKMAAGLVFNHSRVADMTAAAATMWTSKPRTQNAQNAQRTGQERKEQDRVSRRHKRFQFMFAVATSHELCHAFVGYLSQNRIEMVGYTPPKVSHLSFASYDPEEGILHGESGCWFENHLFGGSLEFYREHDDDHGQTGIPHVLDHQEVAWRINDDTLDGLVEDPRRFKFPFEVIGPGITKDRRLQLGLRSLGSTSTGASLPAGLAYMKARADGPVLLYNISAAELRRIPLEPRPLKAVRVA